MIVVHFDPPLERKDFETVLPKIQEMFPDWEWCSNTGTPTIRDRVKILPGIIKDLNTSGQGAPVYAKKVGALLHYGRFKHYGESDCLAYTSGWSQADTDSYIRQGHDVKVIDGWQISKTKALDIDDVFNSLSESKLKKIIRESIDDFDWIRPEVNPAEEFIYQKFMECKLEPVGNKNWFNWTRYVDKKGKILFLDNIEIGEENTILYFDHHEIYQKLKEMGLNYEEIKKLCIDMLYETHKRKVSTAYVNLQED
jgi:hypothetical protein